MTEPADPFGAPLRHLRRMAPPWADQHRTVCGRPTTDVANLVTWDEAAALYRKHGQQRAAFLFCQTCIASHRHAADRPSRWDEDPAAVVTDYASRGRKGWQGDEQTRAELLALADLVNAHPDEYAAHVARRLVPDALAQRRARRRNR